MTKDQIREQRLALMHATQKDLEDPKIRKALLKKRAKDVVEGKRGYKAKVGKDVTQLVAVAGIKDNPKKKHKKLKTTY